MSEREPDLRDRAEYAALRAAAGVLRALPARAAFRLGEWLGDGARRAGLRREVVASHLAAAFPDRSPEWVGRVARAAYRHFGREAVAVTRLRGEAAPDPDRRLWARAVETYRELYPELVPKGSGAIVVTGHLGNWELAGAVIGQGDVPAVAVVKDQRNPRVNRWIRSRRASIGLETVPLYSAGRRLTRALAEGELVLLVADQDALGHGIFVDFMGRPASTHRGPAALSLRHDVPLLFGALVRESPEPMAPYRAVLEAVDRSGNPSERELTRRWVSVLEREIRKRPGQYLWFHRRWKTRPPEETAG